MNKKRYIKILKTIVGSISFIGILGIIIYLLPVMKNLSTLDGQIEFKNRVNNSGI